MDDDAKAKFKDGCEKSGGSWVENPDGTFQCNLKYGGTVKCSPQNVPCTYTAKIAPGTKIVVDLNRAAIGELLQLPSGKAPKRSSASKAPAKKRK
jgi:hypothetical protein